jgi:hypothetical protein
MEVDVLARNLKYACMELLNLAKRELPCTWMHYSQKYRVKLHPLGKELAKFASNRVLRQEHIDDTSGSDVGSQPAEEGSASEERSAMSGAEVYVVSTSIAMKLKRQRCTRAYMRRVLDVYLKNTLRTVNPVKLKNKKQCSPSEEPVKTKDVNKKDDQCQAMEKPAKAKTVTWMIQGATKAMSIRTAKTAKAAPRVTPTQSKWRIWDPGRSKAVVLRG